MIRVRSQIISTMIDEAKKGAPLEICGYLGANQAGIIEGCFPIRNTDASKEHYSMDPEDQFEAIRKMRKEGLKLKAAYHSHPNSPARPSQEDIRLAYDPNISYLIVSLENLSGDVKAFTIRDGTASPEDIVVEKDSD